MNDGRKPAHNKGFAIAGVQSFVDSVVVNESFVLRMKFSAKTPRHRKPPKRYRQPCERAYQFESENKNRTN